VLRIIKRETLTFEIFERIGGNKRWSVPPMTFLTVCNFFVYENSTEILSYGIPYPVLSFYPINDNNPATAVAAAAAAAAR